MDNLSLEEIEELIRSSNGTPESILLSLVQEASLPQRIYTLYFAFGAGSNIQIALTRVWEYLEEGFFTLGLVNRETCIELIEDRVKDAKFPITISRIIKSHSLPENIKLDLLVRALVRTREELTSLFPNAEENKLNAWWEQATLPRIGLMTGVFDPITNTHLQIMDYAIEQICLDRLVVVPVFLSKKNRGSLPWKERWEMVSEGIKSVAEAVVIDVEVEIKLQGMDLAKVYRDLRKRIKGYWIQIGGADAFQRWKQLNLYEKYLRLGLKYFVVERPSTRISETPAKYKQIVTIYRPELLLTQSAKDVRQKVLSGKSITEMVPPNVEKIIKERGYYLPPPSFRMPWYVSASPYWFQEIQRQLPFVELDQENWMQNTTAHEIKIRVQDLVRIKKIPILIAGIEMRDQKKVLLLVYQQNQENPPITFSKECIGDNVEADLQNLLEELIHSLIGH